MEKEGEKEKEKEEEKGKEEGGKEDQKEEKEKEKEKEKQKEKEKEEEEEDEKEEPQKQEKGKEQEDRNEGLLRLRPKDEKRLEIEEKMKRITTYSLFPSAYSLKKKFFSTAVGDGVGIQHIEKIMFVFVSVSILAGF